MLPPDFRGHSVGTATFDRPNSLFLGNMEVLRLYQRVDYGTWWASPNHDREHLSDRKVRLCSSYKQGKKGVSCGPNDTKPTACRDRPDVGGPVNLEKGDPKLTQRTG